jgi:CRISPR-associated endonuclease Csn1
MKKDYTIGLDIGTNSVGWAVVTEDYKLIKRNMKVFGNTAKEDIKKNFWGVRLFEEGHTAEDRRTKRTTRRRFRRRKNRIGYLQNIFFAEILKVDSSFFDRLNDSFLVPDEKSNDRHPIFGTLEEETAYHEKYETIYHLRKSLADSDDKADIRLIYIALAHIIKYRGHFLIEGKLNTENISIEKTFKDFLVEYNLAFKKQKDGAYINPLIEKDGMTAPFSEPISRAKKAELVFQNFKKEEKNGALSQFIKLIVGNQGNFKKVFEFKEDAKLQFSKEEYDELLEELLGNAGDQYADVFTAAKNVYDAIQLSNILIVKDERTKAKLSASMIERYDQHKKDLVKLKKFVKNNIPDKYSEIFKDKSKNGYAGYVDGGTTEVDFYQYLKNELKDISGAEYFIDKINQENFLRKQRTFDNGVIPHQIHLEELKAIVQKQEKYYPFLRENKEKIESIFSYRIPYFVGPLSTNSPFSWLTTTSAEPIRPWNASEIIDYGQSATDFIERMTNFDTYLPSEKVLPKHSLIYQKYTIFNELTKVSYTDERGITQNFSSEVKVKIFNQLFKENRKVTSNILEKFLSNEFNLETTQINGLENKFNANYETYHDLLSKGISKSILDDDDNSEMLENIIKILTIFEDNKMIRTQLNQYAGILDEKTIKKLSKRHYTGWGRLSKKLINGIVNKENGKTILDYLIDDDGVSKNINRNFMQLINDDSLSFKKIISEAQIVSDSADLTNIVQSLAGSPAIKKGILQSLKIVDELVTIMGYAPKNIVVEMARENQTTSQGKNNSIPRKAALDGALKEIQSELLKDNVSNQELQDDRIYLYYLQDGRDMYSGDSLDINNLSHYHIDHIIPRSFTTDNSLDNRVLVKSKDNGRKSDSVLGEDIVKKMDTMWQKWKRVGLISQLKYDNLTKVRRGGLSDDDKANFIRRQLVETRQITKNVAAILHQRFNPISNENEQIVNPVKIITLKASLTSQFRNIFALYKIRELNDYHHAHDAYLNSVVAMTLLKVYPQLKPEFVYGEFSKFNSFKVNKATAKKNFYSNLMNFFKENKLVENNETNEILWDVKCLSAIRKVIGYNQMNIVKKTEIQKGGFYKESVLPKGESTKLIPRKEGWNTQQYGGVGSPTIAYSIVIQYEKGKSKKISKAIVGIPVMEEATFEKDAKEFLTSKKYMNAKVICKLPKYTLYESNTGYRRMVASAKEVQKGNQLVLPPHLIKLLFHAKHVANSDMKSYDYVKKHKEEFLELLEEIKKFSDKYLAVDNNLARISDAVKENWDSDVYEFAESFVNLLQLTAMGAPTDFKFFGKKIPRKRYTATTEILESTIIYQSITGLYETRITLEV